MTIELPCGHVDPGEEPKQAAARELLEETGYRAEALELLGVLNPDTGRLGNRLWCYFAAATAPVRPLTPTERNIEAFALPPAAVAERIAAGDFANAMGCAIFLIAAVKGRFVLPAVKLRAAGAGGR